MRLTMLVLALIQPLAGSELFAGQNPQIEQAKIPTDNSLRMDAVIGAFRAWVAVTCELREEQLPQLSVLVNDAAASAESNNRQHWRRVGERLNSLAPIEFTSSTGSVAFLQSPMLKATMAAALSPDQSKIWHDGIQEREEWQLESELLFAVSCVDQSLRLSNYQIEQLAMRLRASFAAADSRYLNFGRSKGRIAYFGDHIIETKLHAIGLTAIQRSRLADAVLPRAQRFDATAIEISGPVAEWQSTVDAMAAEYRKQMQTRVQELVSQFTQQWNLNPTQEAHLSLAGKGAVARVLAEWKSRVEVELNHFEKKSIQSRVVAERLVLMHRQEKRSEKDFSELIEYYSAVKFKIPGIAPQDVCADLIFNAALDALNPSLKSHLNSPRSRSDAVAGFVVSALDKELWLLPRQREPLRKLILHSLSEEVTNRHDADCELAFLAIPLKEISREQFAELLSPEQLIAIDQLKAQFHYEPGLVKVALTDGTELGVRTDGPSKSR